MEGPKQIAAGAIGSRIAGRLTADLILRSPQYMSCVGEYQIDLRGEQEELVRTDTSSEIKYYDSSRILHFRMCSFKKLKFSRILASEHLLLFAANKVSAIENLGATQVSRYSSQSSNP